MKLATNRPADPNEASSQKRIQLVMKIMRYRQLATLTGWGEEPRQRHIKVSIEHLEQELREIEDRECQC